MGTWVVVYMAHSRAEARRFEQMLSREGVLVRLKPVYRNRSEEDNCYEVLVLRSEAASAREIFLEQGF
ncbi:MAG: hypothetical protein ACOX83_09975 [Candidatus Spyradocola sp.]|jgi:hypothetical protein